MSTITNTSIKRVTASWTVGQTNCQKQTFKFLSFNRSSRLGWLTGSIHIGRHNPELVLFAFCQVKDSVARWANGDLSVHTLPGLIVSHALWGQRETDWGCLCKYVTTGKVCNVVLKAALVTVWWWILPFLCSTTWEPCCDMQGPSSSEQRMSCLFLRRTSLMGSLEAFPQLHRNTDVIKDRQN